LKNQHTTKATITNFRFGPSTLLEANHSIMFLFLCCRSS